MSKSRMLVCGTVQWTRIWRYGLDSGASNQQPEFYLSAANKANKCNHTCCCWCWLSQLHIQSVYGLQPAAQGCGPVLSRNSGLAEPRIEFVETATWDAIFTELLHANPDRHDSERHTTDISRRGQQYSVAGTAWRLKGWLGSSGHGCAQWPTG